MSNMIDLFPSDLEKKLDGYSIYLKDKIQYCSGGIYIKCGNRLINIVNSSKWYYINDVDNIYVVAQELQNKDLLHKSMCEKCICDRINNINGNEEKL
jgi:hypothetical protein